ncbi:nitrilase-related carbon-nitrogen hydrolase [Clostridium sp. LBM24168]
MKYKVASINCEPIINRKQYNIEKEYKLVEEAAKNGAKLIALPEMATTGYCWYNRREIKPFVEKIPGITTNKFLEISKKYECYIVIGMPEVDIKTDLYYNSAVLMGPKGIIGVHRKTHSYISEPKWTKQGDLDHMVFETPIGNIGMLICMDIHFIETARIEGLRNADVIVHISNWLAEKTPSPYWITRAFENGCYVLESNRCGLERTVQFSGGSALINPDGEIESYVDGYQQIMYGEIDIQKARIKLFEDHGNKYVERKPREYIDIMSNSYLWNPLDFFNLYGYDPIPDGKKSRISVVQFKPVKCDINANIKIVEEKTKEAVLEGSELIVFPELTLTGVVNKEEARKLAETDTGVYIDKLIDISMKYCVYIVVGMIEKDRNKLYNTAILIGPCGVVGKYRKIHLSNVDKEWATPGNLGFLHFNIPVGRIGIMIGYDAMFPESARMLALNGVDLICCPSAVSFPKPYGLAETKVLHNYPIPRGYSTMHWHLWRVRAGENNCYLAFANQIGYYKNGKNYIGRSGIFGPDTFEFPRRETILSSDREETVTFGIDTSNILGCVYPTNIVRRKDLLCMRQPLWYDVIIDENPPVLELFKK